MSPLFLLLIAGALQAAGPDVGAPLTVRVTGMQGDTGEVRVEVCSRRSFVHSECEFRQSVPAQAGETVVTFPAVPSGEWAVQAYHDRNANHEVDRGVLGVPVEEVGFSRQPPVGLHGPNFGRSAFLHEGTETVTVRLRRYLAPGR